MLTVDNIRTEKNKTGFRNVMRTHSGHGTGKPYNARIGGGGANRKKWLGPRRDTPEEAAQDYCDYINGKTLEGQLESVALKYVGHSQRTPHEPTDEELAARELLRRLRERKQDRQGCVYLVGIEGDAPVKIGYSVDPEARLGEMQTGNPRPLKLLATLPGDLERERSLHARYIKHNLLGEWFYPTPELLSEFGLLERKGNS